MLMLDVHVLRGVSEFDRDAPESWDVRSVLVRRRGRGTDVAVEVFTRLP